MDLPLAVGPAISQTLGSMLFAITFVSPDPEAARGAVDRLSVALASGAAEVKSRRQMGPGAADLIAEAGSVEELRQAAAEAIGEAAVDVCVQPAAGRRKGLFLADMDSTMIGCECIDELADYAGVKAQVAAVTERAMRGEIEFEEALRQRVATLKGLPEAVLGRCYAERVRLNPGARVLVRTMAAHGTHCMLVSGGFDAFTVPVAEAAGFAEQAANHLIVRDGMLTGEVTEPILGREAKLDALLRHRAALGLSAEATLAVGDGANDLGMIEAAGLGVAYRAKPVVAARANARLDHADLTALLYFQGYAEADFVRD
ncbi:MAG: phosphoserine phosphatase SerB [Caulobacteraceae bacterium]